MYMGASSEPTHSLPTTDHGLLTDEQASKRPYWDEENPSLSLLTGLRTLLRPTHAWGGSGPEPKAALGGRSRSGLPAPPFVGYALDLAGQDEEEDAVYGIP